jgi:hypothetical protein
MYAWIWNRLPGNAAVRAGLSLALVLAVVAVLFQWVFPWAEPLLPFSDVTVNNGGTTGVRQSGTPSPSPVSSAPSGAGGPAGSTASTGPTGKPAGQSSAPSIDGAALPTYVPRVPLVPTGVVA